MTSSGTARRSLATGALVLMVASQAVHAQHEHDAGATSRVGVRVGAHAVGLLTHVSPLLTGTAKTEAYLTQPTLFAEAFAFGGALRAHAAISLEAQTIERGELGAGNHGEGYVDRRHPHTYLHELVLAGVQRIGPVTASLSAGRGFAPFGTDDPMMRPFVKFPVNHHMAQVLERLIAIGGMRSGPLLLEAGLFSGNEPLNAEDFGALDRFGDSWAARVTIAPRPGVELQTSFAAVESPELPRGGGPDQRKWSASARYERTHAIGTTYVLAEWARTAEREDDAELLALSSVLLEATVERSGWRPGLRIEHTQRAEEARTFDPFRTPWPHGDSHVLGVTQWTIVAARLERRVTLSRLVLAPFAEGSFTRVTADTNDLFQPQEFYGSNDIWTGNIGVRMTLGSHRARMGRYGVAGSN